ncbi:MAG: carbohydrate kinase [Thalassotalea sp.]|nr:carbohydrate kinase [Thalassotalea sp.]
MKVICIGEILIDFVCTQVNVGLKSGVDFVKKGGGAPANVAACIGHLGGHAEFVGSVGNDPFGHFLLEGLQQYRVKTDYTQVLSSSTTLAFVSLADEGEREFTFNRGADEQLILTDSCIDTLLDDSILHLGSATALLGGHLFDSYLKIARQASTNGNLIVFDPNYRIDLWKNNIEQFKERCDEFLPLADVIKVSEEELVLLTGISEQKEACKILHEQGINLIFVTLGKHGCLVSQNEEQYIVPAYEITAVDTTGAGDSFIGAILYQMANNPDSEHLYEDKIREFVSFAQKVSAKVCSKVGAMTALPSLDEVFETKFIVKNLEK